MKKSEPLVINTDTGHFFRKYKQGVVSNSKEGDAALLGPALRQGDMDELRYYEAKDSVTVLEDSFNNAKICLTLKDLDGNVAAMFGVGWTNNPRVGRVWLLSSDYLYEVGRPFLLECPSYIELFLKGHDVIYNHVHDHNLPSIKWLEWLGFQVTAKFPEFGADKQPFTEYSLFASNDIKELYLNRNWLGFLNARARPPRYESLAG